MRNGLKFLQIQQLTLAQSEEVFNHRIVQTIAFAAQAPGGAGEYAAGTLL